MDTLHEELLELVSDIRHHIEEQIPKKEKKGSPPKLLIPSAPTPPPVEKKPVQVAPKQEVEEVKPAKADFSAMRALISQHAPQLKIAKEAPSDEKAKVASHLYEIFPAGKECAILSFAKSNREKLLLQNLSEAIDRTLIPAELIDGNMLEEKRLWDLFLQGFDIKVIIADPNELRTKEALLLFYREKPATGEFFLGNIRIVPCLNPSHYLQNPQEKKELWNLLTREIRRNSPR